LHIPDRFDGPPRERATLDDMEDPGSVLTGQVVPFPPEPDEPATGPSDAAATGRVWPFLFKPRWLAWHLFAVVAVGGMLWLGDWQFHRAVGGNGLSWAYTFEWPLFAAFGVVFWARTIRDEFRARHGIDTVLDFSPPGQDLPGGIGTQQANELAYDDSDDEDLARYNAYLAKLNRRTKAISADRKAVAKGPGRKAITHG
jgi:hypothetical protein